MWFWKTKQAADHLQAGVKYMQRGNFTRTIACCNQALQLDLQHVDSLVLRGKARHRQGDVIDALSDLNRALTYAPTSSTALLARIQIQFKRADTRAALLDLCSLVAVRHPAQLDRWKNIKQQRRTDLQAINRWLSSLLKEKPRDPILYLARATSLLQLEEIEQSLLDLDQAFVLDSELIIAQFVKGQILLLYGEAEAAASIMTQIIKRDTYDAYAHLLRGQARADQGDYTGARLDFGRVIQLAPLLTTGYTKLAAIHSILGRFDDVFTFSNAAIHLNPNEVEAYCYRAVAHRVTGTLANSIADCIQALQIDANDHLPYMVRAMTFIESQNLEYAIKDAHRAVALAPLRARPYLTRGLVWQHKGNFEQANADMSEAIRIEPSFTDAYLARAEMRTEFGDLIGALHDYQYLLKRSDGLVEVSELEQQILKIRHAISQSVVESLTIDNLANQNSTPHAIYTVLHTVSS